MQREKLRILMQFLVELMVFKVEMVLLLLEQQIDQKCLIPPFYDQDDLIVF